jgi:hypothetical protein
MSEEEKTTETPKEEEKAETPADAEEPKEEESTATFEPVVRGKMTGVEATWF